MAYRIINPALNSDLEVYQRRAKKALEIFKALDRDSVVTMKRWHFWEVVYNKMRDHLSVDSLVSFQSDQVFGPFIVGAGGPHFLEYLENRFGKRYLETLLSNYSETLCGEPRDLSVAGPAHITRTSMRHLYYFANLHNYQQNFCSSQSKKIVEIGGGFGNLARICVNNGLAERYFIVDFAPMLAVQYFYLLEFFSPEQISVLTTSGDALGASPNSKDVKIVLMTPDLLEKSKGLLGDDYWMVSTFALTESPPETQEYYLNTLSPSLTYVMGQEKTLNEAEGKPAGEFSLNNLPLLHRLVETEHVVHYDAWGWNFELLVRKRQRGEATA